MLYKGHHSLIRYIPNKAAKFGFKIYALASSSTGYVYRFFFDLGSKTKVLANAPAILNKPGKIVWTLLRGFGEGSQFSLLGKGHLLGLDNYYTCPHLFYEFVDGSSYPLITEYEYNFLSIKKGSLDLKERLEMESHVEHTFQFLSKIPWTDGLKSIPKIAHAHHEKLNGKGYPRGLLAHEIPIKSKMMTIADIYDALTDKDRPYKKAIPVERALDILKMEVKDNHVDNDLLNVFIDGKIYEILTPKLTDHIA
jgi:hypothetical protein